ncbi:MAG: aspartate kinase [Erysipelotrichaceae bacterium]
MIKVAKFGGSSLASGEQMQKVISIVKADPSIRYIVVSAPGSLQPSESKVTDLLYVLYSHMKYGVSYEALLDEIKVRFTNIIAELELNFDLQFVFDDFASSLQQGASRDFIVSRGEYWCGKILAQALHIPFVDAQTLLCFAPDGSIDYAQTKREIEAVLLPLPRAVIPGFYGRYGNGIKIFSRGGSDITGSILARLVQADLYENWTDVSGIYRVDPRIVPNPQKISTILFSELRELSYMGANVLHEEALFPLTDVNIPIQIKNTNAPLDPGTRIVNRLVHDPDTSSITGIAGKQGYTSVNIYKHPEHERNDMLLRALSLFQQYQVNVEHIPSSIDSFSFVCETKALRKVEVALLDALQTTCSPRKIRMIDHISLIAIVGRNMANQPGISGQVFGLLGQHKINIKMINQGSDELDILLGVSDCDYKKTIALLYEHFLEMEEAHA